MSKIEKMIARLKSKPTDYTYTEARALLSHLGYIESNKGKTSGSRVKFFKGETKKMILLHKPHPGEIMKMYQVRELIETLEESEEL